MGYSTAQDVGAGSCDAVKGLPMGLPGAVEPTRYVGGTEDGPPVTGDFEVGDFVVDPEGVVSTPTIADPGGDEGDLLTRSGGVWVAAPPEPAGFVPRIVPIPAQAAVCVGTAWSISANSPVYLFSPAIYGYPLNDSYDPDDNYAIVENVLLEAGTWTLSGYAFRYVTTVGILTVEIDDVVVGTMDWLGDTSGFHMEVIEGIEIAETGYHTFRFYSNTTSENPAPSYWSATISEPLMVRTGD